LSGRYRNWIGPVASNGYEFGYKGQDGAIVYLFDPRHGLDSLAARLNGEAIGRLMESARGHKIGEGAEVTLLKTQRRGDVLSADYSDGTTLRLQIWQKSLVVDVINRSEQATELNFGQFAALIEPRTIAVPYLTYGNGPRPCVLFSRVGT